MIIILHKCLVVVVIVVVVVVKVVASIVVVVVKVAFIVVVVAIAIVIIILRKLLRSNRVDPGQTLSCRQIGPPLFVKVLLGNSKLHVRLNNKFTNAHAEYPVALDV